MVEPQESTDDATTAFEPVDGHERLEFVLRLGGLPRLNDVLVQKDIDTAMLAFRQANRRDFFDTLDVCHDYGVNAEVHWEYTDSVLILESDDGEVVDVNLEPGDLLDHLF